jgi:hypothetical protein
MDGIFISYRRDDSAGYAGRLYDRLAKHFGAQRVFMDVEGIEPGADFVNAIEEAVSSCQVLIVIIGDEWTHGTDAAGRRRLDDPNDFIRLETSAALKRNIRVVPVLVDGAVMPRAEDLPDEIKSLARRQAIEISHKQWEASSGELIRTLERILSKVSPEAPVPEAPANRTAGNGATPPAGKKSWVWPAAVAGFVMLGAALWWALAARAPSGELAMQPSVPVTAQSRPAPPAVITPPAINPAQPVAPTMGHTQAPTVAAVASSPPDAPEPGAQSAPRPTSQAILTPSASAAAPAPGPTSQPVPVAALPKILEFKAEVGTTGARLCYQVSNADSVTLSPRPGELERPDKGCVQVEMDAMDKATTFTLTARRAERTVRKTLLVAAQTVPIAKPLAEQARPAPAATTATAPAGGSASALPRMGESWSYRSSGKWPTSPKLRFEIVVQSVTADGLITDALRPLDPSAGLAPEVRRSRGSKPDIIPWTGIGNEFSPYLGAFVALADMEKQSGFPTPDLGPYWTQWYSEARGQGQESVSVPAGTFSAYKVEVWSSRRATGGAAQASIEPVRVNYLIWYAPQVKRYVKLQRRVTSPSGQEIEKDVVELVSYR